LASKAVDESATELAPTSRETSLTTVDVDDDVMGVDDDDIGVFGWTKRAAAAATAADSVVGVFSQKMESLRSKRFGTSGNLRIS
jgi:hypothetical protein